MPTCQLDHIVIAAASLPDGVHYIREKLGVDIPGGGQHPGMGTHNHLMRIGRDSYLEVIAVDPAAPPLGHARWYALDDPGMQTALRDGPRLITWVARTVDVDRMVQGASLDLGRVLELSRGTLTWRLTVPEDGRLLGSGVIPHIIEWPPNVRPWETMADLGCRLEQLTLAHPDSEWMDSALRSLCPGGFVYVTTTRAAVPRLSARIRTATGVIVEI